MKTVDHTKPWVLVHPGNSATVPEIAGPGGINLDAHGATAEQAREIVDMLNTADARPEIVSVQERIGKINMRVTGNIKAVLEAIQSLERMRNPAYGCDGGPQQMELHIVNTQQEFVTKPLDTRLAEILAERDAAQEQVKKLTHERDSWYATGAQYARDVDYFQGIVDQCARAIGPDAFLCDDGTYSESPLRAKVGELVESMAAINHLTKLFLDAGVGVLTVQDSRRLVFTTPDAIHAEGLYKAYVALRIATS